MKVYRFTSKGGEYSTFIVDTQNHFQMKLDEFKRRYGLRCLEVNDTHVHMDKLVESRMSLYKDNGGFNLAVR